MRTDWEASVLEFHEKIGAPEPRRIDQEEGAREAENTRVLREASADLQCVEETLALAFEDDRDDRRLIRAKLIVSEAGEVLQALAERDEVALADGIADTHYVLTGTSLTYEIPEGAVFAEVHRSNMTKHTAQDAVVNHTGDKGKGEGYSPPDVAGAIERGRRDAPPRAFAQGDRLATRDGRRIGNSTVFEVLDGGRYDVLTDFGKHEKLTAAEIAAMFHV